MKATEGMDVEIERRCGMVTGASCGHVTLSWIPGDGRNGTRSWVLATHERRQHPPHPVELERAR